MAPHSQAALILIALVAASCGSGTEPATPPDPPPSPEVAIVDSPAQMRVGDLMWVRFDADGTSSLSFAGVPANSAYRLLVQSAAPSGSYPFSVGRPEDAALTREMTHENADELRGEVINDQLFYFGADDPGQGRLEKNSTAPAPAVGEQFPIRVPAPNSYYRGQETTATVLCVGAQTMVALDDSVESGVSDEIASFDRDALCNKFDEVLQTENTWFGPVSDVNDDGKVMALLTPAINQTALYERAPLSGAFRRIDLFTSSNEGNGREIVYLLVPDPAGQYGVNVDPQQTFSTTWPSVFAHELQHLFYFYNHEMAKTPDDPAISSSPTVADDVWLTEGISHLVEDLMGYPQDNLMATYLQAPSSTRIAGEEDFRCCTLEQRGGIYLLLRFLFEQHPRPWEFLRRLVTARIHGIKNLETAFDSAAEGLEAFPDFLLRSGVAMAVAGSEVTTDPRYVYQAIHPRGWTSFHSSCTTTEAAMSRHFYTSATEKMLAGNGQWLIELTNTEGCPFPEVLLLSAPPEAIPQGAVIRVR